MDFLSRRGNLNTEDKMPIEELIRSGRVRTIVRWGEPVMHSPTHAVVDFGPSLQTLIADMFATNIAADGAGLAAPQIGP